MHGTGANALFNVVFDDGDEEDLDMYEVNLHLVHEKTPPSSKKGNTKRKRKGHEGESDDTDGVIVTPTTTQINNHGRGPNWRSTRSRPVLLHCWFFWS